MRLLTQQITSCVRRLQLLLKGAGNRGAGNRGAGNRGAGKTLGIAESCTGGLLSYAFSTQPGASAYFAGGIVSYTEQSKHELLGVELRLIKEHSVVSPEVAVAMARGVRVKMHADWGLGVTGWAGPKGPSANEPYQVGTVCLGLCSANEASVKEYSFVKTFKGKRVDVQQSACLWALETLEDKLNAG